jgi:cbb3-type cytochrome oxidase maturation protein
MSGLLYLIPIALFLGALGLVAFLWALKSSQFEDLDGAANRILFDDDTEGATPPVRTSSSPSPTESPSERTRKA